MKSGLRAAWELLTKPPSKAGGHVPPGDAARATESASPAAGGLVTAAVLCAAVGAAIALFTTVSLLGGMNQVILGTVVSCAGVAIAFRAGAARSIKVPCAVLAGLAVYAAISDEVAL